MQTITVNRCIQAARLVPMIRLRGDWLAREGFASGQKLAMDVLLGTLSLTPAGRTPKARYSVPEAQGLLGQVAEKLRALAAGLEEIHEGVPAPHLDDGMEEEIRPDLAAEILGTVEFVLGDCLAPAVEALGTVAKLTEEELLRELRRERSRITTAGRFPPSGQLELALAR